MISMICATYIMSARWDLYDMALARLLAAWNLFKTSLAQYLILIVHQVNRIYTGAGRDLSIACKYCTVL